MRVWRVCDASMEKQLNDLSMLTHYQNRQVILNYYHEDDLLYKREGFHFIYIQLTETALSFTKKDGTVYTIEHSNYPCSYINNDFQNYYTLRYKEDRLDIYFP